MELAARIVNSDLSSARKTRVDALGDDEAILRKIACLDHILRKAGEHNGLHPFVLDNEDPEVAIPVAADPYHVKRKRMEEKQDKKLQANVQKFFEKRLDAGGFYSMLASMSVAASATTRAPAASASLWTNPRRRRGGV